MLFPAHFHAAARRAAYFCRLYGGRGMVRMTAVARVYDGRDMPVRRPPQHRRMGVTAWAVRRRDFYSAMQLRRAAFAEI